MQKVGFFLVGAPKCGTTSVAKYLQAVEGIAILPKEIHYFGSDLDFSNHRTTAEQYAREIARCGDARIIGDASVYYLFSERAAEEIAAYNPDAKIVILLRQPVDMMYSLHGQLRREFAENIAEFSDALAAETDRSAGANVPKTAAPRFALRYRQIAYFSPQVSRFYNAFGQANVKCFLLEDLEASPAEVTREILDFIGVPEANLPAEFRRFNRAAEVKRPLLIGAMGLLTRTNYKQVTRYFPPHVRDRLWRMYYWLAYTPSQRQGLDAALRKELTREFRPSILELAALIRRDLSHWLA